MSTRPLLDQLGNKTRVPKILKTHIISDFQNCQFGKWAPEVSGRRPSFQGKGPSEVREGGPLSLSKVKLDGIIFCSTSQYFVSYSYYFVASKLGLPEKADSVLRPRPLVLNNFKIFCLVCIKSAYFLEKNIQLKKQLTFPRTNKITKNCKIISCKLFIGFQT